MERLSFDGGVQSQPHGHSKAWLSVVSMQSRAMQLHSTTRSGGLCRAPLDCWVLPSFSIVGKVTLKRPRSALFTKIARAREDPEKKTRFWEGYAAQEQHESNGHTGRPLASKLTELQLFYWQRRRAGKRTDQERMPTTVVEERTDVKPSPKGFKYRHHSLLCRAGCPEIMPLPKGWRS